MIFTVGYDGAGFTPADLAMILDDTKAVLVDVRARPQSRLRGWGTRQIKTAIGEGRYVSRIDLGGGRTAAEHAPGIDWLRQFDQDELPNCVLFCKEENPAACHRHLEITGGLDHTTFNFPGAVHIFRDQCFEETAVDAIINGEGEDAESVCQTAELARFVAYCNRAEPA